MQKNVHANFAKGAFRGGNINHRILLRKNNKMPRNSKNSAGSRGQQSIDQNNDEMVNAENVTPNSNSSKKIHILTQSDMDDIIQESDFSKTQAEIFLNFLKQRNLIDKNVKI